SLAGKQLLCEKAEALAAAVNHDAVLAAVKERKAEWKAVGPVPRDDSEAIWKRFRAACDVIYAGRDTATSAEVEAANASGVSGFANRLPLEGIVAKLS